MDSPFVTRMARVNINSIRDWLSRRAVAVTCGTLLIYSAIQPLRGQVVVSPSETKSLAMAEGRNISFRRLPPTSGLSQTRVSEIVQDDDGFIWFGTQNGLNRFDGYKCKVFKHDPRQPDSLSGVYIYALFKDRSGSIWVASDQFLDRFDPVTESFRHYVLSPPDHNGLTPTVIHISQDPAGLLWLSTTKGLFRLDPVTGHATRFVHDAQDLTTIGDDEVKSTGEDRQGKFWVGTARSLDEFDRATGKVKQHIAIPYSGVGLRFHEDRFGVFWLFYGNDGLPAVLDRNSGKLTRFRFDSNLIPGGTQNRVYAMLEDHDGNMWFGTAADGLLNFDREHQSFVSYVNRVGESESLAENRVTVLFEDREQTIWVGLHQAQPNFFSTKAPSFEKFTHESGNPNSLGSPLVSALYVDHLGVLWVGTDRALTRIVRNTGQYLAFKAIPPTEVLSVLEQGPNTIWFGTSSGLKRYERNSATLEEYRGRPGSPSSCNQSIVERLLLDPEGTLWAATWEGLCRFDSSTQRFTTYKPDGESPGLDYHAIAQDHDGNLWLGGNLGLHKFDPKTGRFVVYSHAAGDLRSLSNNRVNSVYFDHSGTLWVGTQSGLDRFDPVTGTFQTYDERQGLAGNVVSCVLEDARELMWMSTNRGVSNLDPKTGEFKNYTIADGLPGPDLSGWGACFKSATGEMFFGGFSGATAFFPDRILDDPFIPKIALTDFRLSGVSVPLGRNLPLAKSINHTDQITLSHTQNVIAIEFSALSYVNPETSRYRYKLEGLDTDWNEVDSAHRVASYTTLPYRTYTFHVETATSHGPWGEPGATLRIRILPPWWGTLWFRLLCATVIVASLWAVYFFRLNRVSARIRARMQERLGERERIARELHDTLLQGIQGLVLRFQAITERIPSGDPVRQMMEKTLDRADEVITEGRDRVKHLRGSVEPAMNLAEALARIGIELSQGSSVEFTSTVEGDVRPLHPLIRDETYWIGHEALANAFQHSQASHVELELAFRNRIVRIRVRDNGMGIDSNVLAIGGKPEHWGMRGMRERAKAIGAQLDTRSVQGVGTEVELTVPARVAYRTYVTVQGWRKLLRLFIGDSRS